VTYGENNILVSRLLHSLPPLLAAPLGQAVRPQCGRRRGWVRGSRGARCAVIVEV